MSVEIAVDGATRAGQDEPGADELWCAPGRVGSRAGAGCSAPGFRRILGAMDCDHCGAPVRDEGAFCSHCGGRIKRANDPRPAHATATAPERFDLVLRHSGYARACAHEPKVSVHAGIVGGAVFAAFSCFMLMMGMSGMSGHEAGGFMYVWASMCLLFVALGVGMVLRTLRYAKAPVVKSVAVVVDERVQVSGGGKHSGARTSYYATLQARDGARRELGCDGSLAGRIAAPDIGVAFTKEDQLVDFIRFEV
jgi:hypothetical protein